MQELIECKRCDVSYEGDDGAIQVCDECFEWLEAQGYSLDEMADDYPADEVEEEGEVDP